jgi:hypothetical protein
MAISSQVKESINQAVSNLREALAFAARSEHGICIATISDILIRLESIESMEEMMQKFGHPKSGPSTPTNIRFD